MAPGDREMAKEPKPDSHPSPPPPSTKYPVLKLTLLSAEGLKSTWLRSQTYAKLWIQRDQKVCTKTNRGGNGADPRWNEKFVFAVTDDFLNEKESVVHVDIYRKRFLLKDELVGRARCLLIADDGKGEKMQGGPARTKAYPVDRGGSVTVKLAAVWKMEFRPVGKCGEVNWGMRYDEMMMEEDLGKKKGKNRFLGCYAD